MKQILSELSVETTGEGFTDITFAINQWISKNKIYQGILVLSIQHTSCSLTITENADPRVLEDLSSYMRALVPEEGVKPINGKGKLLSYQHADEGADDMPAHIKSTLTCTSLSLSIDKNKLVLGTWQAVYLWEHRYQRHSRKVCLHAIGEIQEISKAATTSNEATLLANKNGSNLNKVVLQRHKPDAWTEGEGVETNVDLLIDRIHDLTSEVNFINQKGIK